MGRFTDEEEAEMKRLWEEDGMSASQLARYFGKGATRNVIIGVVHRRGWKLHAKPTGRQYRQTPTMHHIRGPQVPKPQPWMQEAFREEIHNLEPYGPRNDIPANGLCRYIRDEPHKPGWACCGYPTGDRATPDTQEGDSSKSYCNAHSSIMWQHGTAGTYIPKRRGPKVRSIKLPDVQKDVAVA